MYACVGWQNRECNLRYVSPPLPDWLLLFSHQSSLRGTYHATRREKKRKRKLDSNKRTSHSVEGTSQFDLAVIFHLQSRHGIYDTIMRIGSLFTKSSLDKRRRSPPSALPAQTFPTRLLWATTTPNLITVKSRMGATVYSSIFLFLYIDVRVVRVMGKQNRLEWIDSHAALGHLRCK